jgi:hypothetical protein
VEVYGDGVSSGAPAVSGTKFDQPDAQPFGPNTRTATTISSLPKV